jgi:hypothetical protein
MQTPGKKPRKKLPMASSTRIKIALGLFLAHNRYGVRGLVMRRSIVNFLIWRTPPGGFRVIRFVGKMPR